MIFSDGVRLRDEHRRRDQKSLSSRRSSTDSSEEGFNLNLRDLKVKRLTLKTNYMTNKSDMGAFTFESHQNELTNRRIDE